MTRPPRETPEQPEPVPLAGAYRGSRLAGDAVGWLLFLIFGSVFGAMLYLLMTSMNF